MYDISVFAQSWNKISNNYKFNKVRVQTLLFSSNSDSSFLSSYPTQYKCWAAEVVDQMVSAGHAKNGQITTGASLILSL